MVIPVGQSAEVLQQGVPDETTKVNLVQRQTTDVLQQDSLWQSKQDGAGLAKPYGQISTDAPGQTVVSGAVGSGKDGDVSISGSLKFDPKVGAITIDGTVNKGPSVEERSKLVDSLDQHIHDQAFYDKMQLLSWAGVLTSCVALKPTGIPGMTLFGASIVGSFLSSKDSSAAGSDARSVIRQMPKIDSDRFSKYETDIQHSQTSTTIGFAATGAVALVSLSNLTKVVNKDTSLGAALFATGNHAYQSLYSIPNRVSGFETEVADWKKEMKNK